MMTAILALSGIKWDGEHISVRYLLTETGYTYFEEDVIYDTYKDAVEDFEDFLATGELEFEFDDNEEDDTYEY